MQRYQRQITLPQIGKEGQRIIQDSSILIVGCGALGTHTANALVRGGVGEVTIVDRDYLEITNLHRLGLLDEKDLSKPKALAVKGKLSRINSEVNIFAQATDVNSSNVEKFIQGKDLVCDCTDNLLTRYLINDACIKHRLPWIYAAVIGTTGMTMEVLPEQGPCLRCLYPNQPPPGSLPTCETAGVVNTIPQVISALQVNGAYKILLGEVNLPVELTTYDIWTNRMDNTEIKRNEKCICCSDGNYQYLEAELGQTVTVLCGREAVQVNPLRREKMDLVSLRDKLEEIGEVEKVQGMLRLKVENYQLNVFGDGRAIIKGTDDEEKARSLYTRYLGN